MGWNDFISKIIGNKAQRDLNEINPVVKKVKEAYAEIEQLSHDELKGAYRNMSLPRRRRLRNLRPVLMQLIWINVKRSGTRWTNWKKK